MTCTTPAGCTCFTAESKVSSSLMWRRRAGARLMSGHRGFFSLWSENVTLRSWSLISALPRMAMRLSLCDLTALSWEQSASKPFATFCTSCTCTRALETSKPLRNSSHTTHKLMRLCSKLEQSFLPEETLIVWNFNLTSSCKMEKLPIRATNRLTQELCNHIWKDGSQFSSKTSTMSGNNTRN